MCKVTSEFGGCLGDWHSPAACQGLVLSSRVLADCNREQPHLGSDGHGFFVPKESVQLRVGSFQVTSRVLFGDIKQIHGEQVTLQHITGSGSEGDRATLHARCWSPVLLSHSNMPGLHMCVLVGCKNPSATCLREVRDQEERDGTILRLVKTLR